jgi:hypothetical protein
MFQIMFFYGTFFVINFLLAFLFSFHNNNAKWNKCNNIVVLIVMFSVVSVEVHEVASASPSLSLQSLSPESSD